MQRIVIAAVLGAAWIGSGYFLLSGKVSPKPESKTSAQQTVVQTMVMQPASVKEPSDDLIAKTIQAMEPKAPVPAANAKTAVAVPRPAAPLPAEKKRAAKDR